MKLKTLIGIIGLLIMTAFVFFGQTFCDFLNGDYGDWLNATLWTVITAIVLTTLLIIAVVGFGKQGASAQTWHTVGVICFVMFIGASCFMAAPSVVHTFTVLSRKGDIAAKAREVRDNTDMMYQEYRDQSAARSFTLKSTIDVWLVDAPVALAGKYPNDNVRNLTFAEDQAETFQTALLAKCDKTWEDKLRDKYESTLIGNFSLLRAGASLKSLIAFHKGRHTEFSDHFSAITTPFEQDNSFTPPQFNFVYKDYATEVSDLFSTKSANPGGIALFVFALLLGSCPFIFVKNNKVKNARKAKGGEGVYSQGYPLK